MNLENFRAFCLSRKSVTEEFPFGEDVFVYKVKGKMFALTSLAFSGVSLKCDPENGMERREQYPAVQPGYHLNKKHWITVQLDGSIKDQLLRTWTDESYALVVQSMTKSQKLTLDRL